MACYLPDRGRYDLDLATPEPVRVSADWLSLREPADAAARAPRPSRRSARSLPRRRVVDPRSGLRLRIDGPLARGRLPGPQHWVLYDRDDDLLALAAANPPARPPTAGRSPSRRGAATSPGWDPGAGGRRPDHRVRAARHVDRGGARAPRRAVRRSRLPCADPAERHRAGRDHAPATRSTATSPARSTPTSGASPPAGGCRSARRRAAVAGVHRRAWTC